MLGDDFLAEMMLPKLVELLSAQAPGMRFQLLPMSSRPLAPQFAEGILDLAFSLAEEIPDWIERTVAARGELVSVASKGNRQLARAGLQDRDAIPLDLFLEMRHVLFAPNGGLMGSEDRALELLGKRRMSSDRSGLLQPRGHRRADRPFGALPPRFALSVADRFGLNVYSNPFEVVPEVLYLYWHRRDADDAEHRWMRERILEILEFLDHVRHPVRLARGKARPTPQRGRPRRTAR